MTEPITIDGALGEGGGQVLRSALALALVRRVPIRIESIRAGRRKPGLQRQHLTAVQAACQVGVAEVDGDRLGSKALEFHPRVVETGDFHFSVGTAGSTTLVLQTVLPALMMAEGPSTLTLEGGTHNPFAPPYEFLARTFLPLVERMGPRVTAKLLRAGFFPAGCGRIRVSVTPVPQLRGITLLERGAILHRRGVATIARLPRHIAKRELATLGQKLGLSKDELRVNEVTDSAGPGNVVQVEIASESVTETFTAFGKRGVRAEAVAREAAEAARRYLRAEVPVGIHLADQLLLPLALAGEGSFRTLPPTSHTMTHIEVIRRFLDIDIAIAREGPLAVRIDVGARNGA